MSRTIVLAAGVPQEFYEVSNFFRILEATGPLSVEFYFQGREVAEALDVTEGYAEKFEVGQFDRVRLVSPTTQTVQFVQRLGNTVLYDKAPVGDSNIVGSIPLSLNAATLAALESVDLNPATLAALESTDLNAGTIAALRLPQTFVSNYVDATAMGAGTVQQVFAPAANVNGAMILAANWAGVNASFPCEHNALIANSAAPGGYSGRVIAQCRVDYNVGGGTGYGLTLERPLVVPAGNGLWFYCQSVELRGARSVLYQLL